MNSSSDGPSLDFSWPWVLNSHSCQDFTCKASVFSGFFFSRPIANPACIIFSHDFIDRVYWVKCGTNKKLSWIRLHVAMRLFTCNRSQMTSKCVKKWYMCRRQLGTDVFTTRYWRLRIFDYWTDARQHKIYHFIQWTEKKEKLRRTAWLLRDLFYFGHFPSHQR